MSVVFGGGDNAGHPVPAHAPHPHAPHPHVPHAHAPHAHAAHGHGNAHNSPHPTRGHGPHAGGHAVHHYEDPKAEFLYQQRLVLRDSVVAEAHMFEAHPFDKSAEPKDAYGPQMHLKNDPPGNWPPIFAKFADYELGAAGGFKPLHDGGDYIIILNAAAPYEKAYMPADKHKAGMGFAHLLVLPKKHIYNAVSLKYSDIALLERMAHGVKAFVQSRENRAKVAKLVLEKVTAMVNAATWLDDDKKAKLVQDCEQQAYVYTADNNAAVTEKTAGSEKHLELCFHVHPNHSVGYLHMHAFTCREELRAHCTKAHDHKNTPLQTVLMVLMQEHDEKAADAERMRHHHSARR